MEHFLDEFSIDPNDDVEPHRHNNSLALDPNDEEEPR